MTIRRTVSSVVVVSVLCGVAPARLARRVPDRSVAPVSSHARNEIVPGFVLVKTRVSTAAKAQRFRNFSIVAPTESASAGFSGLTYRSRVANSGWTLWKLPNGVPVASAVDALRRTPGVAAAQPLNRVYPLLDDPDDPDFHAIEDSPDLILNFGEDDLSFRRLWHLDEVFAFAAWSDWPNRWYTAADKPADAPLVAVIDTGCDMDHPDFVNAGGTGTDVADGGQIERGLSAQFQFGEMVPDGDPYDTHGHGTHVAGLAFASGNNGGYAGHGVIGTGYNARGMILRVFDDQGVGTDADAAAAIFHAADHGAEVINLSLGTTNYSQLFQDAVTYAFQKGSLVVCAGNENGSGGGDLGPIYPAACSGALAVAASGPEYSSTAGVYGGTGTYLDVGAPGGSVIQGVDFMKIQFVFSTATRYPCTLTDLSNLGLLYPPYTQDYSYLAGTSMACPIVSGAAALYMGKHNLRQGDGWSNLRTYRAIERSANGSGPYGSWGLTFGYGVLDMESLLAEADTRGSVVGGVEGIVYYNATALANVAVRARKVGTARPTYSTTTRLDGTYRFEALPPGEYEIVARPFGALKSRMGTVLAGADTTGFDFWCGTYFADDETPPEVPLFSATSTTRSVTLSHWGFDTETGIDLIRLRIGTTTGGNNVLKDRIVSPGNPSVVLSGLTLTPGKPYYLRGTYVNGAGLARTVDIQFNGTGPQVTGTVDLQNWSGRQEPVTLEVRTPGTTAPLESHSVMVEPDGSFSVRLARTGTFDVAVKGSHWLRQTRTSVSIPPGGVSGLAFVLVNGDVDGNNVVSVVDYSRVSRAFGTRPGDYLWNAMADVDGNLFVDMSDYQIVRGNYRRKGDQ